MAEGRSARRLQLRRPDGRVHVVAHGQVRREHGHQDEDRAKGAGRLRQTQLRVKPKALFTF